MLRNFLQQTILTGNVNNKFLKNFQNSLVLQANNTYKLSIENRNFIMQMHINNYYKQNSIVKTTTPISLPFNSNSKNYIIDWGDGNQLLVYQTNYVANATSNKLHNIGDYCQKDSNSTYFYDGTGFITYNKSLQDICNIGKNIFIKIDVSDSKRTVQIINGGFTPSHIYNQTGTYNIKIEGGFTGFKRTFKNMKNVFYTTVDEIYTNTLFIQFDESQELKTFNGQYKKNSNGTYFNINDESLPEQEQRKISLSNDKANFILSTTTITNTDISSRGLSDGKGYIYKDNILSAHYYVQTIETNYLEKILSWGTNVNWESMTSAFYDAQRLNELPDESLPNINDYSYAFYNCINLKNFPCSTFMPRAIINANGMFYNTSLSGSLIKSNWPPYLCCIKEIFSDQFETNSNILTNLFNGFDKDKEYYQK